MMTAMENFDGARVPLTCGTTLIEASAGTGKTFSIATLYLRLVMEEGIAVDEILAVTYTDAATKELVGRIRQRLSAAQRELERWQRNELDEVALKEPVLQAWLEQGREAEEVVEAIRRLSRAIQLFDEAMISTIHSFCYRALQEYAFESGARYSAELLGESQELFDQAATDFWRRRICMASPMVASLAVNYGYSGLKKWRDLMKGAMKHPEALILPEMAAVSPEEGEAELVGCFQSVAEIWQNEGAEACALLSGKASGVSQAADGYSDEQRRAFAAAMDEWVEAEGEFGLSASALEAMGMLRQAMVKKRTLKNKVTPQHRFFEACEEAMQGVEWFFLALRKQFLSEVAGELEGMKRERNVLLFDDLLRSFHAALVAPGGERLAKAVAGRYRAVLIDEFQDTDPLQAAIFERLFAQGEHQLFLIGDPKQAIYAFRGADLHAYLQAAKQAGRRFGLTVNWRSDARLLEGMNALFSRHEAPFLEKEIRYWPVGAAPGKEVGREEGAPLILRRVVQGLGEGGEISLEKGRARVIADLVQQVELRRGRYGDGEMAVLVRSHLEAAEVQSALLARGIPAVRQTRESVFESEEAAQLQVIMEAVVEPQQQGRVARALLTPVFADGEEADEEWMARFVEWREAWRAEGLMAMWQRLMVECRGRRRVLGRERGERRLTNFLHLAELLHREETERKLGPEALVVRFALLREAHGDSNEAAQLRLESDAEAVQVVTIHKSKGLEYAVVFAPFLWKVTGGKVGSEVVFHDEEQRLVVDLRGAAAPAEHLERAENERRAEELRLLYVAVTRARNCCVIYWGDFKDYAQSALGYLLPDEEAVRELAAALPEGELALEEMGEIGEVEGGSALSDVLGNVSGPERVRGARAFSRVLSRVAFTTSFTGLTRGAPAEAPERDEAMEELEPFAEEQAREPEGIHAFAKGARAGDFVHAVMESIDFAASPETLHGVIAEKLALYGFADAPWAEVWAGTISEVLGMELEPGLRLSQVQSGECLREVEFSCRLPSLRPEDFLAVAKRYPAELEEAEVARLRFGEVQGFLRGAIDLFFRHEGRFYLLDWKSNWLGRSAAAYTPQRMQAAMREHHYGLQARLYTLAADQYLRLRVPGYDYDRHFGGVFYLFLRGAESEGRGVVQMRPSLDLVASMREWLEVQR